MAPLLVLPNRSAENVLGLSLNLLGGVVPKSWPEVDSLKLFFFDENYESLTKGQFSDKFWRKQLTAEAPGDYVGDRFAVG